MRTRAERLQAQDIPAPLADDQLDAAQRDAAEFAVATAAVHGTDREVAEAEANKHLTEINLAMQGAIRGGVDVANDTKLANEIADRQSLAAEFQVGEDGQLSADQTAEVAKIRGLIKSRVDTVKSGKYDGLLTEYGLERGGKHVSFYQKLGDEAVKGSARDN